MTSADRILEGYHGDSPSTTRERGWQKAHDTCAGRPSSTTCDRKVRAKMLLRRPTSTASRRRPCAATASATQADERKVDAAIAGFREAARRDPRLARSLPRPRPRLRLRPARPRRAPERPWSSWRSAATASAGASAPWRPTATACAAEALWSPAQRARGDRGDRPAGDRPRQPPPGDQRLRGSRRAMPTCAATHPGGEPGADRGPAGVLGRAGRGLSAPGIRPIAEDGVTRALKSRSLGYGMSSAGRRGSSDMGVTDQHAPRSAAGAPARRRPLPVAGPQRPSRHREAALLRRRPGRGPPRPAPGLPGGDRSAGRQPAGGSPAAPRSTWPPRPSTSSSSAAAGAGTSRRRAGPRAGRMAGASRSTGRQEGRIPETVGALCPPARGRHLGRPASTVEGLSVACSPSPSCARLKPHLVVRTPRQDFRAPLWLWAGLLPAPASPSSTCSSALRGFTGDELMLPLAAAAHRHRLLMMVSVRDPLRDLTLFRASPRGCSPAASCSLAASQVDWERSPLRRMTFLPLLAALACRCC